MENRGQCREQQGNHDAPHHREEEDERENRGLRRLSNTLSNDDTSLLDQMAQLNCREEQENLQRRSERSMTRPSAAGRRNSITATTPSHPTAAATAQASRVAWADAGDGLKSFPGRDLGQGPTIAAPGAWWGSGTPTQKVEEAISPPSEPELPITPRRRRPSVGQLF